MRCFFCLIILFILILSCNNSAENESKKHVEKDLSNEIINKSVSIEEEAEVHYLSILNTYCPIPLTEKRDTFVNANVKFIEEVMESREGKVANKKYISDRRLLRQLKIVKCDSTQVEIVDTLNSGKSCKIHIKTGEFDIEKHKFSRRNDDIGLIDGRVAFLAGGGPYGTVIQELTIEIDDNFVDIPESAYATFFSPQTCNAQYLKERNLEAYTSFNGQYIYIYFYADSPTPYFTKLVFDREKYITRLVADYYTLSSNASFRKDFIGF